LVKFSKQFVESDPQVFQHIGPNASMNFRVTKMKNEADKEIGYSYKITGKKGIIEVTVIGDSLTHQELQNLNAKKSALLSKCETIEEKVQAANCDKSFVPLNIGRFYITSSQVTEKNKNSEIDPSENIWRVKELHIEAAKLSRKMVSEENFDEIVLSEYKLKTYEDAQEKMSKMTKSISEKLSGNTSDARFVKLKSNLAILHLYWLSTIAIIGAFVLIKGLKPITDTTPFKFALSKAKTSIQINNMIGGNVRPLYASGFVHNYFGFARVKIGIFGEKGEGVLKVFSTKPLFGKNRAIWVIKNYQFAKNDNKFTKIKI